MNWTKDSPEWLAMNRFRSGTASVDDLLHLAATEVDDATNVLPPAAVAPSANNMGEVIRPDPDHASACTARAYAFIQQARALLKAGET